MNMHGNTILITGGGSGIGRGLAEAFHQRGNQVIITGRRLSRLNTVCCANPGMIAVELDIRDPEAVKRATAQIIADHPALNVLINNAGIMELNDVAGPVDEEMLVATVTTNLGGPIRMSDALMGPPQGAEKCGHHQSMPLQAFIEATMAMLATAAEEILVGQGPQMRANPGPQEHVWVNRFNDLIAAGPPSAESQLRQANLPQPSLLTKGYRS